MRLKFGDLLLDTNKQEHLLSILLSSPDVFSRCVSILKADYFDGNIKKAVQFTLDYFEKYHAVPDIITVCAESGVAVERQEITTDKIKYSCEEIELYCQHSGMAVAMWESTEDLQTGDLGSILERMKAAVAISLKRDLGWSFFCDNFLGRLDESLEAAKTIPTGIQALDKHLAGGLARKQVTIFTANSGSGKSIMLNNLAHNYALTGHHVVLLSLELPKEMIFVRSTSIVSGFNIKTLKEDRVEVADTVNDIRSSMAEGSLMIERIASGSSSNDIRSYLTHYELELGYKPDVLLVDYLDKMSPNQGIGSMNISEQDKYKSEQLAELVFDYDLVCATASQQNREAIGNMTPRHDVIAGGLTKINTVDNVISLYMDEQMRLKGEMLAFFLKTRSSDGVGKQEGLFFDSSNLRIHDPDSASNHGIFDITHKASRQHVNTVTTSLPGLEFDENKSDDPPPWETGTPKTKVKTEVLKSDTLLDYMETIGT